MIEFRTFNEGAEVSLDLRLLIIANYNILITKLKLSASQTLILANVPSYHNNTIIWKSFSSESCMINLSSSSTSLVCRQC